jgi:hypothetical protein
MANNKFFKTFVPLLLILITTTSQSFLYQDPEHNTYLHHLLKQQGFIELGNTMLLKKDYADIYYYFDRFIELMDEDGEFAKEIDATEQQFLSNTHIKSRYCSAPPSYRDPRKHSTKRFHKVYFQFIKEHCTMLEAVGLSSKNPDIKAFFDGMLAIDAASKKMFEQILQHLEPLYPGIIKKAYGQYNELTVITKIVRYEQAENGQWGTTPHVDKSALSLILNSDDPNDESLWLCEDLDNPSIAKMNKPNRIFNRRFDCSSALLIPGAECLKVGFNLKPTVHGVRPITRPYRHAAVSFLLIPDVDMSDIVTDFNDK